MRKEIAMRKLPVKLFLGMVALGTCTELTYGQHRFGFPGGHLGQSHWSPLAHRMAVSPAMHHAAMHHPAAHHLALHHLAAHYFARHHAAAHHGLGLRHDPFLYSGRRLPSAALFAPAVAPVVTQQAIEPVLPAATAVPSAAPSAVAFAAAPNAMPSSVAYPVPYLVAYPVPYGVPPASPYTAAEAVAVGPSEVSPAVPPGPERRAALQYTRLLKVVNATGEALEVWLRYETLDRDSRWLWIPGIGAKDDWAGPYKLDRGQSAYLKYQDVLVDASRVRI
jgi:hypothetical protein